MLEDITAFLREREASEWNQQNKWDVPVALGITALAIAITAGLLAVMYFSG